MAYVAVAKALYDYTAQDPQDELSFKEDQILYIVTREDDDWWKAKLKEEDGDAEGSIGLIPCSYVEEVPPMNQTRALYAYQSTSAEELSMEEDAVLHVYDVEGEWFLVRIDGAGEKLGFVPINHCEEMDEANATTVTDVDDSAAGVEAQRAQEVEEENQRQLAARQRELRAKDTVETWSVAELDGSTKKKGTLGVGNGAIFFASEADKSPVKQFPITELAHVQPESAKVLNLTLASGQQLRLNTGDASSSKAIVAKLEKSKEAAGESLQLTNEVDEAAVSSEEESVSPPAAASKSVSWADAQPASPETVRAAPANAAGGESCVAAYGFDAEGEDELTITEGEHLTVLERENDEWWLVRNAQGKEGVVPAAYVEIAEGGTATPAGAAVVQRSQADIEAETAATAAAAEAARREEQVRKEEERRAIEQAAHEREEQEAADREIARQIEAEERAKRERSLRHAEEETRRQREAEAAKRREAARGMQPPQVSKRPSAQDVAAAARSLPSGRDKNTPRRPSETNRPKPNPGRIRVWSDRTGQFKVEAEFLGLNGNKVRLHKLNGVIIEVPLEKMSGEDTQMIKRHMARQRSRQETDDDDLPLAQHVRKPSQQMSQESSSRSMREPPRQQRRSTFDWFAFFLDAGCGMDDSTRYAANFDRDRIDETILTDLDASTMRSLGLREGDVIRVRRVINAKFAKKTPEQQSQIHEDEEYARKLQEHENSGGKGPAPAPPPGLFTNSDGKLANNTRRGRPERKGTAGALNTVDGAALTAASEQLSKVSLAPIEPTRTPPITISPAPEPPKEQKKEEPPKHLLTGFDDDAWTIKPAHKPASPGIVTSPTVASPVLSQKTGTDALLAQIQGMRPASTEPPKGGNFDVLAGLPTPQQQQEQQRRASSAPQNIPPPQSYGLGAQNTSTPMSQIQQQPQQQQPTGPDPNAPRGPLAPVRVNEALLNPLQPSMTGMFVPTHQSNQQQQPQYGMMSQPTGMMPQGGMMSQQTGMMGYPQQQTMQPAYTGFGGGYQQQQNSSFNAIANLPPPQVPQQTGSDDKFAPTNIFAAMKRNDFGKPEEQNPQSANKYDALRPLATGYNGAPGMMPQMTGMPMQMQQTGMPMNGGGMGMMPNMTGFNPQMGQMGYMGQNQYGQY